MADPADRFRYVHAAMAGLKESGQAVGAQAITRLADAAAPTVLSQAARLQSRQRFFNLTVTNVPGPQIPLYMMGRKLEAFYPKVPLVLNTALGIAIMSYDGQLFFGLLGDYDALTDLDALAADLDTSIRELAAAAGVRAGPEAPRGAQTRGPHVKALYALAIAGLAAGACLVLIMILANRDSSQVQGTTGPGTLEPDRGSQRVTDAPQTPASPADEPPTSGPHRAEPVQADRNELSDDQILEALALGNVVIAYDGDPPRGRAGGGQRAVRPGARRGGPGRDPGQAPRPGRRAGAGLAPPAGRERP